MSEDLKTEEHSVQPQQAEHHTHIHNAHNKKKHEQLIDEFKDYIHGENFRLYLLIFAIYLVISLVMFWYVTINANSAVAGSGGDVYDSLWDLWWVPYAIFTLHTSPYFTHTIYFPIGANLATQTLSPLAGLLTAPFQAISLTVAYNIVFFLEEHLSYSFYHIAVHCWSS